MVMHFATWPVWFIRVNLPTGILDCTLRACYAKPVLNIRVFSSLDGIHTTMNTINGPDTM